ncbi:MAG: GFA family protein [Phenylobacterium sp.]|nr:MAG: GFA family protein [Phenylobacterium sp.]
MKIDGGCHCGEITYEAEINPDNVIICHCTDCQTISGAPYRVNVPVLVERFRLSGAPRTYRKTGDSGDAVATTFCATCGAALYSSKGETPSFVFLRLGGVKQRAQLAPKKQGFCRSAMPWALDIRDVLEIPAPAPSKDA